ncbi:Succinate dehydrogenase cytochrome b subunit [hydrothermal vent metagenome]|uniref:Succinate dehydrogenase cytochrome b subunit n=1 Tax=hydrothermal vent metagenome TaxID=652676 RepID=A0A3B1DWA6_9ZZZZ
MNTCCQYFKSSIGKKQVVAITGLALILFLVGHLAGNLFIYIGPEAFNKYAKKLADLRPGLLVVEAGLAVIFCIHMWFTALLVMDNRNARPVKYLAKNYSEKSSLATRLMPFTGTLILAFVIWHLLDFTFSDHHGPLSMIHGKDFGLYGVLFNSFGNPIHSLLYIIAMIAIGLHLSHAIQSIMQTFGCDKFGAGRIQKVSNILGIFIGGAFASIPIFIFYLNKVGMCCLLK